MAQYEAIRSQVRSRFGIELGPDRQAMVRRRLGSLADGSALVASVVAGTPSASELSRIADVLTTNHTHWGREAAHFDRLIEWLDRCTAPRVRIWCAASSTGEEPYTLWAAAQLSKHGAKRASILATDISDRALSVAREGLYEADGIARLPSRLRQVLFTRPRGDGMVSVVPEARKGVMFRRLNLMTNPLPFRHPMHVIFCRNVVIYFEGDDRRSVVQRQVDQLVPGGLYCFGLAESIPKGVVGLERVGPSVFVKRS